MSKDNIDEQLIVNYEDVKETLGYILVGHMSSPLAKGILDQLDDYVGNHYTEGDPLEIKVIDPDYLRSEITELCCLFGGFEETDVYKRMLEAVGQDPKSVKVTFQRQWREGDFNRVTFETERDINTWEVSGENQHFTSHFRMNIPLGIDKTIADITVDTIGDSTYGGFMVCEDATHLFDVQDLARQYMQVPLGSIFDAQEEWDNSVEEEDDE